MAVVHTQTVEALTILNNADNIVSEVAVKTVSYDDSDQSNTTIDSMDYFSVDTSGGTGASGFVAYASLTQSAILAWTPVADGLVSSKVKAKHENWISSVLNPPAPQQVNKDLPW
tara:strand:- start:28 stop:369 length:342 start_codon:yes stop_codon:yes gene_type:complete